MLPHPVLNTSNKETGKELGLKTGLYTSPHLHDYTERICFDMVPVAQEEFAQGLSQIKPLLDSIHHSRLGPISTFGALTALFSFGR